MKSARLLAALNAALVAVPARPSENRLKIFVSVAPQEALVQAIAGAEVQVSVVVGSGFTLDDYEPLLPQMQALARADLWVHFGTSRERAWLARLQNQAERGAPPQLDLSPLGNGRTLATCQSTVRATRAGDPLDPHTWLSPSLLIRQAQLVTAQLVRLRPDRATAFRRNLATLTAKLQALKKSVSDTLEQSVTRSVLVTHSTLGHFADEFSLRQLSLADGSSAESAPACVAELLNVARRARIENVFVQANADFSVAENVARALGIGISTFDPYEPDVFENLKDLAHRISVRSGFAPLHAETDFRHPLTRPSVLEK